MLLRSNTYGVQTNHAETKFWQRCNVAVYVCVTRDTDTHPSTQLGCRNCLLMHYAYAMYGVKWDYVALADMDCFGANAMPQRCQACTRRVTVPGEFFGMEHQL